MFFWIIPLSGAFGHPPSARWCDQQFRPLLSLQNPLLHSMHNKVVLRTEKLTRLHQTHRTCFPHFNHSCVCWIFTMDDDDVADNIVVPFTCNMISSGAGSCRLLCFSNSSAPSNISTTTSSANSNIFLGVSPTTFGITLYTSAISKPKNVVYNRKYPSWVTHFFSSANSNWRIWFQLSIILQ